LLISEDLRDQRQKFFVLDVESKTEEKDKKALDADCADPADPLYSRPFA